MTVARPIGPTCAGCEQPITSGHGLYVRGEEQLHPYCEMALLVGYVEVVRSPELTEA